MTLREEKMNRIIEEHRNQMTATWFKEEEEKWLEYYRGRGDVWLCLQKIMDMDWKTRKKIFQYRSLEEIIEKYTVKKVMELVEEYEEQSGWEEMTAPCKHCGKDMTFKIATIGEPCEDCKYKSMAEQEPKTDKVMMRDATPEEQKSVDDYIKSISKPTGVNFGTLESCDDAINRQYIIEQYKSCADMLSDEELEGANLVMEWVYKAPPVNPQEQTGKWTLMYEPKNMVVCSECGKCAYMYQDKTSAFCPHCGAKMFEPQERSDKE